MCPLRDKGARLRVNRRTKEQRRDRRGAPRSRDWHPAKHGHHGWQVTGRMAAIPNIPNIRDGWDGRDGNRTRQQVYVAEDSLSYTRCGQLS
jgi:hypothetical protein